MTTMEEAVSEAPSPPAGAQLSLIAVQFFFSRKTLETLRSLTYIGLSSTVKCPRPWWKTIDSTTMRAQSAETYSPQCLAEHHE